MASPQSLSRVGAPAHLVSVLQHFPPVTFAFAYGSGAHYQPGLYETDESQTSRSSISPSILTSRSDSRNETNSSSLREGSNANAVPPFKYWASKAQSRGPVIDFIFAVKDANEWHQQNLARNPNHYSWVGRLGANAVCGIAEAVGVGVHFNPLVQLDEQTTIKYGVIEAATLERDLTLWEHLYIAGRLHKPVTQLTPVTAGRTEPDACTCLAAGTAGATARAAVLSSSSAAGAPAVVDLAAAQATNLQNALAAALVLLPPTFTEEELLRTLVGLSYRGDVRLLVGAEDPHKVARIVRGSWNELYDMYLPLLTAESRERFSALGLRVAGHVEAAAGAGFGQMEAGGGGDAPSLMQRGSRLWRQSKDPAAQGEALRLLAPGLLHEMAARLGYHVPIGHLAPGTTTQREVVDAALRTGAPQRLAAESLAVIVRRSSIYQAAAGLLAAGGGKAVQYVGAKLVKALRPLLAASTVMATATSGNKA